MAKITYKAKYQIDWRGIVSLGLLLGAGTAALILKNESIAGMLFAGAVGTLSPSPVRTKPAVITVPSVPPPPVEEEEPSALPLENGDETA